MSTGFVVACAHGTAEEARQPLLCTLITPTRHAAAADLEAQQPLLEAGAVSHVAVAANWEAQQPPLRAVAAVTSCDATSAQEPLRREGGSSHAADSDAQQPPGAAAEGSETQQLPCAGDVANHDAAAIAPRGNADPSCWVPTLRDVAASRCDAAMVASKGGGALQRQAPPSDDRGGCVTDIEKAAAALREEAASVLRQAAAASRLGADLSLAAVDDSLGCADMPTEAGATLPEPEDEPLLSLTSEVLGECGYTEEEEEECNEDSGCGQVHQRTPPVSNSPIQAEHYICLSDSDEETDVEDASDASDLLVEHETVVELLQLLTQGLFGEEAQSECNNHVPGSGGPLSREGLGRDDMDPVDAAPNAGQGAEGITDAESEPSAQACAAGAQQEDDFLAMERARKAQLEAFLKKNGYRDVRAPKRTLLKTKFPIHTAAKQGDAAIVQLLLEEGADPMQKTSWGKTAVQIARSKDKSGSHAAVLRALGGA